MGADAEIALRFLRNYFKFRWVLKYNTETGEYEELERESLPPGTPKSKGFYVRIPDGVAGVYASNGPIFFFNDQRFSLSERSYEMSIMPAASGHRFILSQRGRALVSIPYQRADDWPDLGWTLNHEEDTDWFLWLKNHSVLPAFHAYYSGERAL